MVDWRLYKSFKFEVKFSYNVVKGSAFRGFWCYYLLPKEQLVI